MNGIRKLRSRCSRWCYSQRDWLSRGLRRTYRAGVLAGGLVVALASGVHVSAAISSAELPPVYQTPSADPDSPIYGRGALRNMFLDWTQPYQGSSITTGSRTCGVSGDWGYMAHVPSVSGDAVGSGYVAYYGAWNGGSGMTATGTPEWCSPGGYVASKAPNGSWLVNQATRSPAWQAAEYSASTSIPVSWQMLRGGSGTLSQVSYSTHFANVYSVVATSGGLYDVAVLLDYYGTGATAGTYRCVERGVSSARALELVGFRHTSGTGGVSNTSNTIRTLEALGTGASMRMSMHEKVPRSTALAYFDYIASCTTTEALAVADEMRRQAYKTTGGGVENPNPSNPTSTPPDPSWANTATVPTGGTPGAFRDFLMTRITGLLDSFGDIFFFLDPVVSYYE